MNRPTALAPAPAESSVHVPAALFSIVLGLASLGLAPPAVCASALLVIQRDSAAPWILMLLGYALFQTAVALRLSGWFRAHPFATSWWAFTFGVSSSTLVTIKLALNGSTVAQTLALPVFIGANLFIGYLCIRTLAIAHASLIARPLGRTPRQA